MPSPYGRNIQKGNSKIIFYPILGTISIKMSIFAPSLFKMMKETIPQTQFVTLAIGATAQRMGISATELFNRLKHHGLVRRLLFDCYDTLHSESIDGVVWNVQEALKSWDAKEKGGKL